MREHAAIDDDPPAPGARHETRDISTRVVIVFGVSLVVGAVLVHLAIWLLYVLYGNMQTRAYPRQYPMAQVGPPPLPPAPRLQTQPREELKNMRAEEDRYLNSYGWADPARGAVHLPIERAMEVLLQQGLPARAQAPAGSSPGMPVGSSSGRTTTDYRRY